MKNFFTKRTVLIVAGVVVLLALVGFFIFRVLAKKETAVVAPTPIPSPSYNLPKPSDFQWGANTSPNALGDFNAANWQQQLDIAKQLGVKWVRFAWEWQAYNKVYIRENQVLEGLWKNGFNVILVVEPLPGWETADTYTEGYNRLKEISTYYNGRIPYYQLINEGDAMTVSNATSSGEKTSDYNPAKYEKIKQFLEGASKGLSEGDPAAKTIITTVCTQTGYLDLVNSDKKIKFDTVGLDWYNWCDPIATKKGDDAKTLTVTKLKSFGKPMIITENNAWPQEDKVTHKSTIVDEDLQTKTISDTAEWAYANKDWVKGYYVFSLFDDKFSDKPLYFGIYNTTRSGKASTPTSPKKAFTALQAIIAKYSK